MYILSYFSHLQAPHDLLSLIILVVLSIYCAAAKMTNVLPFIRTEIDADVSRGGVLSRDLVLR